VLANATCFVTFLYLSQNVVIKASGTKSVNVRERQKQPHFTSDHTVTLVKQNDKSHLAVEPLPAAILHKNLRFVVRYLQM
jgi:hypothetical protein